MVSVHVPISMELLVQIFAHLTGSNGSVHGCTRHAFADDHGPGFQMALG